MSCSFYNHLWNKQTEHTTVRRLLILPRNDIGYRTSRRSTRGAELSDPLGFRNINYDHDMMIMRWHIASGQLALGFVCRVPKMQYKKRPRRKSTPTNHGVQVLGTLDKRVEFYTSKIMAWTSWGLWTNARNSTPAKSWRGRLEDFGQRVEPVKIELRQENTSTFLDVSGLTGELSKNRKRHNAKLQYMCREYTQTSR